MSILNKNYIKSNISNNKDKPVSYRWTHGATDEYLGSGIFYYSIPYFLKSQT